MRKLYEKPRDSGRFQEYLRLLGGGSPADLAVPVVHFNPMAKEPLVAKLEELQQLGAEAVAAEVLQQLNAGAPVGEPGFRVALNLADDLQGGWTNRYTTDFANTFELGPLLKRGFCTPVFWASENYSPALVRRRTLAQGWRTRYRLRHPQPCTVAEHLAQEQFVALQFAAPAAISEAAARALLARYEAVQQATDRPALLTFFYGDEAARQLGYAAWGHWPAEAGFQLARWLAARCR